MDKGKINVVYNTEEQVISEKKFDSMLEYKLVSDKDMVVNNVHFTKDVPVVMTGILAELCLMNGNGHIKLYNEKAIAKKKQLEEEIEKVIEKKLKSKKKDKEE